MKSCPTCNRTYADDTITFCLIDGAILSAPFDPHATLQIPAARPTYPPPTQVMPHNLRPADKAISPASRTALVVFGSIQLLTIVAGSIAVFVEVRSIVLSGLALFLIGPIVAWFGWRCRNNYGMILGLSAPFVSLLCVAIINIYRLPPADAEKPMGIIATLYLLIAAGLGLATLVSAKSVTRH